MDDPRIHPEALGNERECFYCWDGQVFLGDIDFDGEEVIDVVRCRKCFGTGVLHEDYS